MNTRMKRMALLGLSAGLIGFCGASLAAAQDQAGNEKGAGKAGSAEIGKAAPDFELTDIDGKAHKLSDYKGKTVILEWWNPECPYVVHLYREGAFKTMGNDLHAKDDFVWLAINSGRPGAQGAGLEKSKEYREEYKMRYPVLLDEDGTVGRMYQATRTPHMYVIDAEGILRYQGAIDNAPMGRPRGSDEIVNYVQIALDQMARGETISPDTTRSYGCTIKYASGAPAEPGAQGRERGERGERGAERGERGSRGSERGGR